MDAIKQSILDADLCDACFFYRDNETKEHLTSIKRLLKNGANIHCEYETPLTRVIFCNKLDIIKLLLKRGADMDADMTETKLYVDEIKCPYDLVKWRAVERIRNKNCAMSEDEEKIRIKIFNYLTIVRRIKKIKSLK